MNCNNCKAEWTPPSGVSITQCPFCGKSLFEVQISAKNAEPHEILLKIVQQYDRKKLGDILLKGMLSDLMPHVEKKYQRIFKQAMDDKLGAKLLELDDENDSIRIVKINTLKDSFKNNNGFDKTADYVVDCFLYAMGWIETVNKEQYSQGEFDKLSVVSQQIDMAFIDGVLHKEEAKAIFSNSQKLGLPEKVVVDLINEKINRLKLKPHPPSLKSNKNHKEIICSSNWYSESILKLKKSKDISDSALQRKATLQKNKNLVPLKSHKSVTPKKTQKRIYLDGAVYEGDIYNGARHGKGILRYAKDDIEGRLKYNGEWKKHKLHGKGVMLWRDGSKYEGAWVDDKRNGKGIMIWADGTKYDGDWKTEKRNGRGILIWPDGVKYEGEWKNDMRNGIGIIIWPNGDKYEGEWKNDMRNGIGKMIWSDGAEYKGEWKDGMRNGQGTITWPNGCKYDGEWKDDMKHGNGIEIWPNGDKAEGLFLNGKRHMKAASDYVRGLLDLFD